MSGQLPWFNWSLKKLLRTEPDSSSQARLKILFIILIFSIAKALIVLSIASYNHQAFQQIRAFAFLTVYVVVLKLLLVNRSFVQGLTHFMIWGGLFIISSNVFMAAHAVNIITLQFVFMAIVSSFYLLGRNYGILYSILSTLPIVVYLTLFKGEYVHLTAETREIAPPGGLIMATLNFVTIIAAHYIYHQAFSANILEKEKLNTQLKEAVAVANRHAQSKSDFLSTMSHELRTPLISVIGISDLLLENSHDEEQRENLRVLRFSATGLHTIVNNILDFNKLETDRFRLEKVSVNLHQLIQNICSGLSLQAKEKGITLVLEMDNEIRSRNVITDPTRLTQITYNLIGNGIKFTSSGSVSVVLKVVGSSEERITIRFTFTDTGIGISPEMHVAIFDPFVQASESITRQYGGTGLGLPIVKRLLTLFDSDIHLKSTPGVGSVFTFDISFETDQSLGASGAVAEEEEFNLEGLRILVAEDNAMNIFLIKKLFQKWNIVFDIAENGNEVMAKLNTSTYDLILMDIHMPRKDGYQTAKEIRSLPDPQKSTLPIIALTASVSDDLNQKIRAVGMDGYLHKPFSTRELFNKIKDIPLDRG